MLKPKWEEDQVKTHSSWKRKGWRQKRRPLSPNMSVTHPWDWLGSHKGRKWLERLLSGPGCQPLVWGLEEANMYPNVPRAPPDTSALCLLQTVFPSSPSRFTLYLSPGHALPPSEFPLISYLSFHLPVREFCLHPRLRHPSCSAIL